MEKTTKKVKRCRTCEHCFRHDYGKKLYCELLPCVSKRTAYGCARVGGNDEACERYAPKIKESDKK